MATRFLRDDNFTTEKAKQVLKDEYPQPSIRKTLADAREFSRNVAHPENLTPTDLAKALRDLEIEKRNREGAGAEANRPARPSLLDGSRETLDTKEAQRREAEDAFSKATGGNFLNADETPRTVAKTVRDAVRAGREQKRTPMKDIAEQGLDAVEKKLQSKSRDSKLAAYDDLRTKAEDALAVLHRGDKEATDAAIGIFADMFGGEKASNMRREFHKEGTHDLPAMFREIKNEIEARAKGLMAENLTKTFKGASTLTRQTRRRNPLRYRAGAFHG